MAALHKALIFSATGALAFAATAIAQDTSAMVQAIRGATSCTLAASKTGVDTAHFDGDESWQRKADGSYLAVAQPVRISFPTDSDGIARTCVVEATLSSRKEQREMQAALEVLLKQKPIKQTDSVIWIFGSTPNVRGLQFFTDSKSEKPEIRFIGAAF